MACCCVCLQMRHPLALAHYANHPAAGTQPNVMVAAFDLAFKAGKSCSSATPTHARTVAQTVSLCLRSTTFSGSVYAYL